MRCANTERGCQWTGTVGTLEDHTASCQFVLVPCPNKCEEDKGAGEFLFIRKHLEEHLKTECPKRAYECQHCGEKGTFASIIEDHDKVCKKKIVACPKKENGCSLSTEQGKVGEHVSIDCGYTEVSCAYESLGCGVKMLRKERATHEKEDKGKHLDLCLATVRLLSERNKTLTENHERLSETVRIQDEKLKILTEQNNTLSEGKAVIFKLTEYASKKENNAKFCSPPFFTHPGGYSTCVVVDANGCGDGNGTHVSISINLLEGRCDDQLHWPFKGTVTFELLNQLGDNNHHKVVIIFSTRDNMEVGSIRGSNKFLSHASLDYNLATNTQYLLNDTLYFRVSVKVDDHKPWLVCIDEDNFDSIQIINNSKTFQTNESMVFKITNFKEWKAEQLFFLFSACPFGYHIGIGVAANGKMDGKGTHVSVSTKLLNGRYDNQLHWPFLGTVTYELLNQLEDANHHKRDSTFTGRDNMKVGSMNGISKFLPHSSLGHDPAANTQYLLKDTLYFRVSVKVDDHKPWLGCTHQS